MAPHENAAESGEGDTLGFGRSMGDLDAICKLSYTRPPANCGVAHITTADFRRSITAPARNAPLTPATASPTYEGWRGAARAAVRHARLAAGRVGLAPEAII
jgi:hypothetical protein